LLEKAAILLSFDLYARGSRDTYRDGRHQARLAKFGVAGNGLILRAQVWLDGQKGRGFLDFFGK
jgi:hypothetical protein